MSRVTVPDLTVPSEVVIGVAMERIRARVSVLEFQANSEVPARAALTGTGCGRCRPGKA